MNKITKKTAIALVGILVFSLLVGNALFAGEEHPGLGLVDSGDVTFITGKWISGSTSVASESNASWEVITTEDVEFAASPYNGALVSSGNFSKATTQNEVNMADVSFIRNDGAEAYLVCVIDGAQVSGKACIN